MRILCPHCNNPIDLVKLTPREEVSCPSCGSSFHLDAGETTGWERKAGQKVGRFELIDIVGAGAFGTVYKARDPELDRFVALKVPRAGNLAGPEERDRFLREARSAAQLRHPSIVTVHEVAQGDGVPCLVSDFAEGMTLTDLLSARRPGFREAAGIIADIADALHYAHGQGVVHRDVKPSNIMIGVDGRPCVMDFGLAKRDAGEITMTVEGQILGTPAYMPPEQARGEGHAVDGRGDVYSLGVILYQMLTGELPFRGTARALLHQVLHDEPRPPRSLNDHVPRDLQTVCLKAMAKEPSRRYPSAAELADDLRRWLKGEPIKARPVGRLERSWRWVKRNPVVAAFLVLLAATVAVTSSLAWQLALQKREANLARDRETGERARAESEWARAEEQRAKAEGLQKKAEGEQKRTEEQKKQAEKAREVAAEQRRLALETIGNVLSRVDDTMKKDLKLAPLRAELIQSMLRDLDRVRDHALKNPLQDRTEALAYARMGGLYFSLNRVADAAVWQNKAHAIFADLAKASPNDPQALDNLAIQSSSLAPTEHRLGNGPKAHRLANEVVALRQQRLRLVRQPVKLFQPGKPVSSEDISSNDRYGQALSDLAMAYEKRAFFQLLDRDYSGCLESYAVADKAFADLPPPMSEFSSTRRTRNEIKVRMADAHWKLGRLDDAEKLFRAALSDREIDLKRFMLILAPSSAASLKVDVWQSRMYLGDFLLMGRKDRAAAHKEYQIALSLFTELQKNDPGSLDLLERLGSTHFRLGLAAPDAKRAEVAFTASLKAREQLAQIDPNDVFPKVQLAYSLARLGRVLEVADLIEKCFDGGVNDKGQLLHFVDALGVAAERARDAGTADRCRDLAFEILEGLVRKGRLVPGDLKSAPGLEWVEMDRRYKGLFTPKPAAAARPLALGELGLFRTARVGDVASYTLTFKMLTRDGEKIPTRALRTATVASRNDREVTLRWSMTPKRRETLGDTWKIDLTRPLDPMPLLAMFRDVAHESRRLRGGKETLRVGDREQPTSWELFEVKVGPKGQVMPMRVKVWLANELNIPLVKLEARSETIAGTVLWMLERTPAGQQPARTKNEP